MIYTKHRLGIITVITTDALGAAKGDKNYFEKKKKHRTLAKYHSSTFIQPTKNVSVR